MNNPFDRPTTYAPCVDDILYWVLERESIRVAKNNGCPAPWTTDPILNKYRFCNVRRRDDRVSQWLIDSLYHHYDGEDLWFISALCRYVNWPPSLLSLLVNGAIPATADKFDPHVFVAVMDDLKRQGIKCWGSAYMLYPGRETGSNKAETVAFRFLLPLAEHYGEVRAARAENRVERLVQELTKFYGWNTFLAGQVAADLTYFEDLGNASDLYSFAPIGPGSSRGLNRLLGRPLGKVWHQQAFNEALMVIWNDITEQLDIDRFTLHDCQSVLCEIDKYYRVLNKEGAPRSIYTPETSY